MDLDQVDLRQIEKALKVRACWITGDLDILQKDHPDQLRANNWALLKIRSKMVESKDDDALDVYDLKIGVEVENRTTGSRHVIAAIAVKSPETCLLMFQNEDGWYDSSGYKRI